MFSLHVFSIRLVQLLSVSGQSQCPAASLFLVRWSEVEAGGRRVWEAGHRLGAGDLDSRGRPSVQTVAAVQNAAVLHLWKAGRRLERVKNDDKECVPLFREGLDSNVFLSISWLHTRISEIRSGKWTDLCVGNQ